MATCPNCGRKLKWYEIKAECKSCGVSIPNYNWEGRLEEDAERAEKKSASFHRSLNMFTYSMWGTKHRLARLIIAFLVIIAFIVPWFGFRSDESTISVGIVGGLSGGKSLIDFFSSFFGNTDVYFTNMGFEGHSGPVTYICLGVLFMALCLLMFVISFFMILIRSQHPKTKVMIVFDVLGIAMSVVSVILFSLAAKSSADYTAFTLGEMSFYNMSGQIMWGYFVALALFAISLVTNILVLKAPAKTHDELMDEYLVKKAEKEEKERLAEIKKEEERLEEEKKAAEEQKKIVAEARAKLSADKNKKKKK